MTQKKMQHIACIGKLEQRPISSSINVTCGHRMWKRQWLYSVMQKENIRVTCMAVEPLVGDTEERASHCMTHDRS